MSNGRLEQTARQVVALGEPCPKCNHDAVIGVQVGAIVPGLILNPSQAQVGVRPLRAFTLCLWCLHRERWEVDATQRWQKVEDIVNGTE